MTGRLLPCSINPRLIDKNEGGDTRLFAEGFHNREVTIEQLAAEVGKGHAFTARVNGRRNANNLVSADLVTVDIDGGMPIEKALEHPIVKAGAALLYTTVGHTDAAHRYRIVFILPKTITDPRAVRALQRSLARRLGGDMSATDAARISFGNRNAKTWVFPERVLPEKLQQELLAQSERVIDRGAAVRAYPTTRSKLRLDPDQQVTLACGQVTAFSKTRGNVAIHCPFHHDERPSAHAVTSNTGTRGIHCSSCDETFWPESEVPDGPDPYSFDEAAIQLHGALGENRSQTALGALFGFNGRANITIVNEGTGFASLQPGLTFVKAPKGAGKTEALNRILDRTRSTILMVHRRTLTRQTCKRLGLPCYLDLRNVNSSGGLGVCFDSIGRTDRTYDLVIIDEVEQVLAHILSSTISNGERAVLFRRFVTILRAAKYVVALDADIGWVSFITLTRLMTGNLADPTQGDLFEETRREVRLYLNVSKPGTGKKVQLYKSKAELVENMLATLAQGKRVFVAANSKRLADSISALVREKLPNCRQLLITADTANGEAQRRFLEAPAQEALNYDVIITSPAAGTGLDITFPQQAELIDVVFGFCEADITTHWDFDQHISRVRQPGAVKLWISPRRLYYETHADVIRRELLEGPLRAHLALGQDGTRARDHIAQDPLVEMATLSVSQERGSKNNIREKFIRHKEKQGFTIEEVGTNDASAEVGRALLKVARLLGAKAYRDRITAAPALPWHKFKAVNTAIESGTIVTEDLIWSVARTKLEAFYRAPISDELVKLDDAGRHRGRVALFEDLTAQLLQPMGAFANTGVVIKSREETLTTLRRLLEVTPLIQNGGWNLDAVFSGDELNTFMRLVEANRAVIETQLSMPVRRDLRQKPISQLRSFLRLVGLQLRRVRTAKAGTGKTYFYALDPVTFRQTQQISEKRTANAWDFLRELHRWPEDEQSDENQEDE